MSAEATHEVGVLIAAIGDWAALPALNSPMSITLEQIDPEWLEGFIERGWETSALPKAVLKPLRRAPSVIYGELKFRSYLDPEGSTLFPSVQLRWARVAAKALRQLAVEGAQALYFDGSMKVMLPSQVLEVDPKDSASLFHLFVEIWGDEKRVCTEGMSLFGLPEVMLTGLDPQSAAAQATVFSAAAQMVCEGIHLDGAMPFRASESFPWFGVEFIPDAERARARMMAYQSSADRDQEDRSLDAPTTDPEDEEGGTLCGLCHLQPVELAAE